MKGMRSLEALYEFGSTSRVLNLLRAHAQHHQEPEYVSKPMFKNVRLNKSMIVKHRLRPDEQYLMARRQRVATKIIFPLIGDSLDLGGQSVFVGQNNFKKTLCETLGVTEAVLKSDIETLNIINNLPSLDPFLLREYLRKHNIKPADCYFDISPVDVEKMREFAGEEVAKLVGVAFATEKGYVSRELTEKMVELILANEADEKLDPLRVALGLQGDDFREGIFAWRGFLFFKWQLADLFPQLRSVVRSIEKVRVINCTSRELRANVESLTKQLQKSLADVAKECRSIITLYDDAFSDLVDRAHAQAFRKFLLDSPILFLELGSLMGIVSHICSFWQFRFKDGQNLTIDALEYEDILSEFTTALGADKGATDAPQLRRIA
ncbi:MAG: hypothetical protein FD163_1823 [Hyphomonadaceae bacterium]|nr:MAG: hypothetical protein FD163_1823 [Hyphomonadaceae bacterium]